MDTWLLHFLSFKRFSQPKMHQNPFLTFQNLNKQKLNNKSESNYTKQEIDSSRNCWICIPMQRNWRGKTWSPGQTSSDPPDLDIAPALKWMQSKGKIIIMCQLLKSETSKRKTKTNWLRHKWDYEHSTQNNFQMKILTNLTKGMHMNDIKVWYKHGAQCPFNWETAISNA